MCVCSSKHEEQQCSLLNTTTPPLFVWGPAPRPQQTVADHLSSMQMPSIVKSHQQPWQQSNALCSTGNIKTVFQTACKDCRPACLQCTCKGKQQHKCPPQPPPLQRAWQLSVSTQICTWRYGIHGWPHQLLHVPAPPLSRKTHAISKEEEASSHCGIICFWCST